jgi:hypothetical protein
MNALRTPHRGLRFAALLTPHRTADLRSQDDAGAGILCAFMSLL